MTKSLSRLWLAQHCGDGNSQNDFKVKKSSNKIVILNRINYKLLQMYGLTFLRVTCTSHMTVISISVYFCNTCIQTGQFEPLPTTVCPTELWRRRGGTQGLTGWGPGLDPYSTIRQRDPMTIADVG